MKEEISDNFKITIEHHRKRYVVEFPNWDVTLDEVFEAVTGVLKSSGWSEEDIKKYLK